MYTINTVRAAAARLTKHTIFFSALLALSATQW